MIYKFCAFYMFIFDQKKVMNYIKSKTNFIQTAVQLGLKTFEKFFGRVVLCVDLDLTYLEKLNYFGGDYPNSKLIYNQ